MEYTFEDWLNGKPEPNHPSFVFDKESLKNSNIKESKFPRYNQTYLEIKKAKNFTFDKSLEYTFESLKSIFIERISGLSESRQKLYIQKTIEESQQYFDGYDIRRLIDKNPDNKFEGIDGKKYLQVKDHFEGLKSGKYSYCSTYINKSHQAVLYFELSDFYTEYLITPKQTEKESKAKVQPASVKFELINLLFEEKTEFKGLKQNQKEKLLSYILGVDARTAKGMKNGESKYINSTHTDRAKELLDKVKKGDFL